MLAHPSPEVLKNAFTLEPRLRNYDLSLDAILETDASDRKISAVLSQHHIDSDMSRS